MDEAVRKDKYLRLFPTFVLNGALKGWKTKRASLFSHDPKTPQKTHKRILIENRGILDRKTCITKWAQVDCTSPVPEGRPGREARQLQVGAGLLRLGWEMRREQISLNPSVWIHYTVCFCVCVCAPIKYYWISVAIKENHTTMKNERALFLLGKRFG